MSELPPESPLSSPLTDLIAGGAGWLIHHLPLGVVVQDAQARILDANPAALRMLGLTLDDIQGRTSRTLTRTLTDESGRSLAPEDRPAVRALATAQVQTAVLGLQIGDNEQHWLNVTAIPYLPGSAPDDDTERDDTERSSTERPPLIYSVFEDVTESHTMRLEFQRSEQRYRALVLATSQYVWTNDPDGYMTTDQPDWEALTGQIRAQYEGYGWATAVHPDDSARTVREWQAAVAERRRFETEHRVRTATGEYRSFSVRAIPLLDAAGELMEWVGLHTDITPLRQAEAALRAVNSGLEAQVVERSRAYANLTRFNSLLLDSAGEGVFGLGPDGRARFANPAAAALLGYSVQELEGVSMHTLIHHSRADGSPYPEAECPVSQLLRSELQGSQRVEGEVFWRKDGSAIPVEYVVTSLPSDAGEDAAEGQGGGVVLLFQDVTEQQRAKAELQRAITELERSNRELEQFAYVSSHDLQEPLRTVGSYAELLGRRYKGKLDPRADQYLDFMQDAVTRMRQLINDLLSFSRIGRTEPVLGPVALEAVMKSVVASLGTVMAETAAAVHWEALPVVQGQANGLHQLLSNLISNAIKFRRPDTPPTVQIRSTLEAGTAHVTVTDNGIGIDPEFHERVFGLFQRLHRREEYEGTGLGLAICRKIAQTMNGEIWLESEVGTGTTVHLRLPLAGRTDERPPPPLPGVRP